MQMSADLLDLGIFILVLLSLIIGLVRGFVREIVSLATWVAAIAFALLYVKPLSLQLPFALQSEVARLGVAFAIIFFGVLVLGMIVNFLFSTAVSSIGLGGVDHFFGGVFGALRGGLIVTLAVILLSLTTLPVQSGWKDSRLVPWFEQSAVWLKGMVPASLAEYLDKPALPVVPVPVPPE